MTWIEKRKLEPEELHLRLAIPRNRSMATCPRVDEAGEPCGMVLSDVDGITGGPVCVVCGVLFEYASARVQ